MTVAEYYARHQRHGRAFLPQSTTVWIARVGGTYYRCSATVIRAIPATWRITQVKGASAIEASHCRRHVGGRGRRLPLDLCLAVYREYHHDRGWSLEELAERHGIGVRAVHLITRGLHPSIREYFEAQRSREGRA